MTNEPGLPVLALDLGRKRVGVAVSDALGITVRRLETLKRSNWKLLLSEISTLVRRFDAKTLVIGLPLNMDGTVGAASEEVERLARNFGLSLRIPVFLQDERLTSLQAESNLRNEGLRPTDFQTVLDSEAAAIILRDFITSDRRRPVEIVENAD